MDNKLEYIPGDLVMVKKSALQFAKDKIFKVISSLSGGFIKVVMLNDSSTTYSISNNAIRPIPLTTEILEKNGWEFMGHQVDFGGFLFDIYGKRDILPYLYYYYATNDFPVSIWGEIVLPNMKYVHELQHLLFGLGINNEMEV